tara:strand:- start:7220 stop:8350 length:1131 start_codon:yes stop_codon:yes gene_type:complete
MKGIHSVQSGGDFVAEGGYGCVFRPNHPCKSGKYSTPSSEYVSKIVSEDDEWSIIKTLQLDKVDPDQQQLVYAVEKCDIVSDIEISEVGECTKVPNFSAGDGDESQFDNLIIPYATEGTYEEYDNHYENPREVVDIYLQLLSAVVLLNDNNIAHRDIKPINIVMDIYNGKPRARLIDFGLSAKIVKSKSLEDIDDWAHFTKKYEAGGYAPDFGESPYPWWPNDIFMITNQKDDIKEAILGEDDKIIVEKMLNLADHIYYERNTVAEDTNGWSPASGSEAGSYFKSTVNLLRDVFSPVKTIEPEDLHYKVQSKFDVFSMGAVMSYDISQWKELGDPPEELSKDISNLIDKMLNAHPYERITIKDAYVEMTRIIANNF